MSPEAIAYFKAMGAEEASYKAFKEAQAAYNNARQARQAAWPAYVEQDLS